MAQPPAGGSSVNRDLGFKVRTLTSIPCKIVNDTAGGTGLAIDLKGYEGAKVIIGVGASADTLSGSVKIMPQVQDSANGSTGWADLDAAQMRVTRYLDVSGSVTVAQDHTLAIIDAGAEDDCLYEVTILPGTGVERYVRALLTLTGTHTNGTPCFAVVERGFPRVEIAAAS